MAVLAALGGLMAYALVREYQRIDSAERAKLQTQAQVVDQNVRRQLDGIDQALRAVLGAAAQGPAAAGRSGDTQLRALADVMPGVRTLSLMDGAGTVLAASRPELLGRNYRERDYFRNANSRPRGDALYLSAPFRSYLGSVAINVARASLAPGGGVALLATATLDPDYFGGLLSSVVYASDMWAAVVHSQGQPFQVAPLASGPAVAQLAAAGSFMQRHADTGLPESLVIDRRDLSDPEQLGAVRSVQPPALRMDNGLIIAVGRSRPAMHAPLWQQARTYALLLSALGVACSLSLWAVQRRRGQVEQLERAGQTARRDNEQRVALALRGADLGLWDWNLVTEQHVLDERGCAMLGLTPAQLQLQRLPWHRRVHPDDWPAVQGLAQAHLAGQSQRYEAEYRMRHADGHWVWVLSRGNVVDRGPDGVGVRMTGTHMDITERRRAAELIAARESELRDFKDMLDQTLDGVFILDAQSLRFTYVNEGAIRMSGYDEDALLHMTPPDLLWETSEEQYRARTSELVAGRKASQLVEAAHRHRDGHAIPVEVFLQYIPATAERSPRFLAVVRDLTARRAETALKLSEMRFRLLIEGAPVAVAILRAGLFDYTNVRFLAMHGYANTDTLAGMPWRDAFDSNSHAALAIHEEQEADAGSGDATESYSFCKDGTRLPVLVASARVQLSEGPATVVFLQDISALKQAEAQLTHARDAAEDASRAKAEFVANMSHEVRTPLNAILGLAYLLERSDLGDAPMELVRKIHSAGRTLLGIINHILDISKIEAGRLEIERAPFRLGDVIDNVATIMGVNAGDKALELVITPPPVGTGHLVGDALRLEQVLVNLSGNAIKFTDRGQVAIHTSLVRRDQHRVVMRFAVTDTGIGIAPDKVADIFSPFTQADSSTTRRFGGTGLGLTICRQLVELMGGEIGVRSAPGQGSEFWFTVPLELAPSAHFSSPAMLQVRALVADDSPIGREAVVASAQALGWQIDPVDSGRAALEAVMARAAGDSLPDVVLLDWKMPGMDGLAAARAIRETVAVGDCPIVIMVTAHARASLMDDPGRQVLDAVLDKPLTSSKLYDAVVEAQRQRAQAAGQALPMRPTLARGLDGLRILVVDDSEINREVAQRILEGHGAAVSLAADGQQALDRLLQGGPRAVDIVLMDVQMPVMDGIEATRRIRALPAFAELPIVALTAGAFKTQQEAARAAGMNEFISKPFDVAHAVGLIRRLTGRGQPTAPPRAHAEMRRPAEARPALAGIDVAEGLLIWADEQVYGRFLGKFARDHGDMAGQIGQRLAEGDEGGAAALAHRLRGVAAHMALPETAQQAAEVERLLSEGLDATTALSRLHSALETALASIAQLAADGMVPTDAPAATATDDAAPGTTAPRTAETQALLRQLLVALDQDDPSHAEPLLAALAPALLPTERQALQRLLDDYDFRGTEALVQRILDASEPVA